MVLSVTGKAENKIIVRVLHKRLFHKPHFWGVYIVNAHPEEVIF